MMLSNLLSGRWRLIAVVIVTLLAVGVSLWRSLAIGVENAEARANFDAIQVGTPFGKKMLADVAILNSRLEENSITGFRSLRYGLAIRNTSDLFPDSWILLTIGAVDKAIQDKELRTPTVKETLGLWLELAKKKIGR